MDLNNLYKGQHFMETPQELLDATIDKVEEILKKEFPDHLSFSKGQYTLTKGSSQVMIVIRPFTDTETCIEVIANVVTDGTITPEIMKYLLRKNAELHFGAFGLLFDNTIVFQYSVAGTNIDTNELLTSINAVSIIADYYDDELAKMSNGKRAVDVSPEEE
ncbi:MAG TPA: YbjN domain-containing protein [Candidatus Kapabacteria bacterium]|nr:YbjN domain-containing protein [Candidatus Kapabacteria bacterium]